MITRTINLGPAYANKMGRVIDTRPYINTTTRKKHITTGVAVADNGGIVKYYAPHNSRYMVIFRGLPPYYDEVGSQEDHPQSIQYNVPLAPVLLAKDTTHDQKDSYSFTAISVYWKPQNRIKTYWEVQLYSGSAWSIIRSDLTDTNYELKVVADDDYKIRVRGKNKFGQYGKFSNELEYSGISIKETESSRMTMLDIIDENACASGHLQEINEWALKALIKTVIVVTASTDWDLFIYQKGGSAIKLDIPMSGNGDGRFNLDMPWENQDTTPEDTIYFKFVDNAGSETADVEIRGVELG